ncbi:MAG: L-ribulose-5-phosphate 3-epimerase [Bifidobacteriaceae bacterium]|jgi:predicted hexulose-6-phosphate isomerase|nr:L-ribulose-5-phosphate 3-epimerase [Bifidobacteriaceae bacterium]
MSTPPARRQVGIYEKALPPVGWPALLETAKAAGFDFIEMSIDESDERLARLDWPTETRIAIRHAIEATGVRIYSICLSAHRRFGLGSRDLEVRTKAQTILHQAIELAVDLGVRVIQIAGYFAYYEPPDPQARARYVAGLRQGLDLAAQRGVMLAVENIDTADMASADDALALVEELGSPWFQVYPDVGNFAVHELDVVANLAKVASHSVGLHLKDARPGEPRRVQYGTGEVPFEAVFACLGSLPYEGPFTLEMWNDRPEQALAAASAAAHWIRLQMAPADVTQASEPAGPRGE